MANNENEPRDQTRQPTTTQSNFGRSTQQNEPMIGSERGRNTMDTTSDHIPTRNTEDSVYQNTVYAPQPMEGHNPYPTATHNMFMQGHPAYYPPPQMMYGYQPPYAPFQHTPQTQPIPYSYPPTHITNAPMHAINTTPQISQQSMEQRNAPTMRNEPVPHTVGPSSKAKGKQRATEEDSIQQGNEAYIRDLVDSLRECGLDERTIDQFDPYDHGTVTVVEELVDRIRTLQNRNTMLENRVNRLTNMMNSTDEQSVENNSERPNKRRAISQSQPQLRGTQPTPYDRQSTRRYDEVRSLPRRRRQTSPSPMTSASSTPPIHRPLPTRPEINLTYDDTPTTTPTSHTPATTNPKSSTSNQKDRAPPTEPQNLSVDRLAFGQPIPIYPPGPLRQEPTIRFDLTEPPPGPYSDDDKLSGLELVDSEEEARKRRNRAVVKPTTTAPIPNTQGVNGIVHKL